MNFEFFQLLVAFKVPIGKEESFEDIKNSNYAENGISKEHTMPPCGDLDLLFLLATIVSLTTIAARLPVSVHTKKWIPIDAFTGILLSIKSININYVAQNECYHVMQHMLIPIMVILIHMTTDLLMLFILNTSVVQDASEHLWATTVVPLLFLTADVTIHVLSIFSYKNHHRRYTSLTIIGHTVLINLHLLLDAYGVQVLQDPGTLEVLAVATTAMHSQVGSIMDKLTQFASPPYKVSHTDFVGLSHQTHEVPAWWISWCWRGEPAVKNTRLDGQKCHTDLQRTVYQEPGYVPDRTGSQAPDSHYRHQWPPDFPTTIHPLSSNAIRRGNLSQAPCLPGHKAALLILLLISTPLCADTVPPMDPNAPGPQIAKAAAEGVTNSLMSMFMRSPPTPTNTPLPLQRTSTSNAIQRYEGGGPLQTQHDQEYGGEQFKDWSESFRPAQTNYGMEQVQTLIPLLEAWVLGPTQTPPISMRYSPYEEFNPFVGNSAEAQQPYVQNTLLWVGWFIERMADRSNVPADKLWSVIKQPTRAICLTLLTMGAFIPLAVCLFIWFNTVLLRNWVHVPHFDVVSLLEAEVFRCRQRRQGPFIPQADYDKLADTCTKLGEEKEALRKERDELHKKLKVAEGQIEAEQPPY